MVEKTDMIDKYLSNCKAKYSPATYEDYKCILKKFERYLDGTPIEEVSISNVRQFLNDLKAEGLASSSLSTYLSKLKSFYQFVEESNGHETPNLDKINVKTYRREDWEGEGREPLTKKEIRKLIEAPDNLRDSLLIALIYCTGCRVSEITGLKVNDVDLEKRIIRVVGKGNKRRKAKYVSELDRNMERWLKRGRKSYADAKENEYFFPSKFGGGLASSTVHQIVHKAAEKAGIQEIIAEKKNGNKVYKVKPHVLRHSFANHAREDGVPERHLKRIMGHSKMSTTIKYGEDPEEKVLNSFYENFEGA